MSSPPSPRHGFTLIEMLVAIAILSFMLVIMARFTGMAEQVWRLEQDRIDNFTKARSMLDLITNDLQRAVFRGDLPAFGIGAPAAVPTLTGSGIYYFTGTTFSAAFYTRLPGATSPTMQVRDVSLVSYALVLSATSQGEDRTALQRSDLYVPWTSGSSNISFQGNMDPLLQNATPLEVAPGVVGFRFAFRRADGSMIDPVQPGQYTGYNPANPVVAVDVGLAVIGNGSLEVLSTEELQSIQTALANATLGNGITTPTLGTGIKAIWDQQVLTPAFYASNPKALGDGLKTFERCVACPPF